VPSAEGDAKTGLDADAELDVPVLVVDDHAVFRDVMVDVVRVTPGMQLVGAAASGEEAITAVEELSPRLVIMDKRMPGIGGVEAARMIRARFPDVVVVLVSVEEPAAAVVEASGAAAFLAKREVAPRVLAELWATYGA
jgi:DNA-binding NarL/FixJ family response regulator